MNALSGRARWVATIALPAMASFARAEIPPGFEVIEIISTDEYYDTPRINNCGEFVWATRPHSQGTGTVAMYDNGVIEILPTDPVRQGFPDINDAGTVVYASHFDGTGFGLIEVIHSDGTRSQLADGLSPVINNLGHIAWDYGIPGTCAYDSDILFYDGVQIIEVANDALSNQGVALNDHDEMTWTRYAFCISPWVSDIMFYSDGETVALPSTVPQAQGAVLNNNGMAVWFGDGYQLEVFADGQPAPFPEPGANPAINNPGDIYFIRFQANVSAWQSYVYRAADRRSYRITDDEIWNIDGDINDAGECVWRWSALPHEFFPGGIRFMRRIRNGDTDLNGYVSVSDQANWPGCMTGPGDFDRLCACRFNDLQHDRDVDLADYAVFQANLGFGQDCCATNHGPGCNDHEVQACVCEVLPSCCTTNWDDTCLMLVELLDCGDCH